MTRCRHHNQHLVSLSPISGEHPIRDDGSNAASARPRPSFPLALEDFPHHTSHSNYCTGEWDHRYLEPHLLMLYYGIVHMSKIMIVEWKIIFNVEDSTSTSTTSMTRKKTINIRDLFVEPNFHELEVVDDDGDKR